MKVVAALVTIALHQVWNYYSLFPASKIGFSNIFSTFHTFAFDQKFVFRQQPTGQEAVNFHATAMFPQVPELWPCVFICLQTFVFWLPKWHVEAWYQTSFLSFFLHKCTFWAQFFFTWKYVNCGKIFQNFSNFFQNFPDFPKISPHDNIFSTNMICDICDKYELCVILLIVSLDVTSPEGGDHLGEGTVSLQTWLYQAPHFQLECQDLLKSIPLSAELQHYRVGRRPPWTWGNVLQAQRWSRVWDLGGEFVHMFPHYDRERTVIDVLLFVRLP